MGAAAAAAPYVLIQNKTVLFLTSACRKGCLDPNLKRRQTGPSRISLAQAVLWHGLELHRGE